MVAQQVATVHIQKTVLLLILIEKLVYLNKGFIMKKIIILVTTIALYQVGATAMSSPHTPQKRSGDEVDTSKTTPPSKYRKLEQNNQSRAKRSLAGALDLSHQIQHKAITWATQNLKRSNVLGLLEIHAYLGKLANPISTPPINFYRYDHETTLPALSANVIQAQKLTTPKYKQLWFLHCLEATEKHVESKNKARSIRPISVYPATGEITPENLKILRTMR